VNPYTIARSWRFAAPYIQKVSGKPYQALSAPALCHHLDFRKELKTPGFTFVPFQITADGRLDGFLGWFEAQLCEGVYFSCAPSQPSSSWGQLYFPALEQHQLRAGQRIVLQLDPNTVDLEARWKYRVQLAETSDNNAPSE